MSDIERRVIERISRRIIPFLMICYFVAYLDRVNIGFAALEMNRALGLTATMFGFGAGIFFLAYVLFEVPSNLILYRVGAPRWIARIMISWGILSALMAFIPDIARLVGLSNEATFYVLRALLGFAEAGFFPGIILYLTLWFPATYRGRIIGTFMAAVPLSIVIGAPISGLFLSMNQIGGLAGWQWLFILEAAPAVLLGICAYFYLTNRPTEARWLSAEERAWLVERLESEQRQRQLQLELSVWQVIVNPRIWTLSFMYFGGVACLYGVGFWLPQIIKGFGLSNLMVGWVSAIPYGAGALFMVWYGYRSDKKAERLLHATGAFLVAASGIAASVLSNSAAAVILAMTVSACGVFAALSLVWTLPTAVLSGTAAAAGIAVINSVGNLAGFFGPYAMGWMKDATGSFTDGLLLIAAIAVAAAVTTLLLGHNSRRGRASVTLN